MLKNINKYIVQATLLGLLTSQLSVAQANTNGDELPNEIKWMYDDAKWGLSHHYIGVGDVLNVQSTQEWQHMMNTFDVQKYAERVSKLSPGYVIFTTTQNSGYLATTSNVYDNKLTELGHSTNYTANRDLIKEIAVALKSYGIKTLIYSPFPQPHFMRDAGERQHLVEQWWIDFHAEKMQDWGDLISGWWFDGYGISWNHNSDHAVWTQKMTDALKAGNPDIAIAYSPAGRSGIGAHDTWEADSVFSAGERSVGYDLSYLLPNMTRTITTQVGSKIQWHDWLYVNQRSDLYNVGWGQWRKNLHYSDSVISSHVQTAYSKGGVSTLDVALNPDGSWQLASLKQLQIVGRDMGTASDNTYSALSFVNNSSSKINYSSDWALTNFGTGSSSTGAFNQDVSVTNVDGASFNFSFTGSSIVYAANKVNSGGRVEVFIDDVSQGEFDLSYPYKTIPQTIIFEKHDLADTQHTLRVVKVSGGPVNVDVIGYLDASVNVALNKSATQSSTYVDASASRAVDGNTDGSWNSGSVSHTLVDPEPWLEVDLGNVYSIDEVVVWNRTDCCQARLTDYYVFVKQTPFDNDTVSGLLGEAGVHSFHQTVAPNPAAYIGTQGVNGQYVRVQKIGQDALNLAEVEVKSSGNIIIPPSGTVVTPTSVTLTAGDTFPGYTAQRLIDGSGLSDSPNVTNVDSVTHVATPSTLWATSARGLPNYFSAGRVPPVFEFDLGGTHDISAMVVWGYGGNTNEGTDFSVEFSTDGGVTYANVENVQTSALLVDTSATLAFSTPRAANKIRVTVTNNANGRGFAGAGGDRVGLGEVVFIAE